MTDAVDTGFDAVIAGEKWEAPSEQPRFSNVEDLLSHLNDTLPPEQPHPTVTIRDYKPDAHICEGAGRCDICFGPLPPPPPTPKPVPVTATVTDEQIDQLVKVAFDDAAVQATKALIQLPNIEIPVLAKLARDVAMDIKERHVILKDYKLTQAQYDFLETHNAFFRNALAAASLEWHAPLSTAERIKVEAAAILEDSLPGLGARMQNKSEGLPGVIEAAKLFAKVAGVGERESGGAGSGERFTINIDLGGDQKISVSTAQDAQQADGGGINISIPTNSST